MIVKQMFPLSAEEKQVAEPARTTIPQEVLEKICRKLKMENADATLGKIQGLSRSTYLVVTPILYERVTITSSKGVHFFGLFDPIAADYTSPAIEPIKDITAAYEDPSIHPIELSLAKRLRYHLAQTKNVQIDLHLEHLSPISTSYLSILRDLDQAHQETFFPRVRGISLGPHILDGDVHNRRLGGLSKFTHSFHSISAVCLHYRSDMPTPARRDDYQAENTPLGLFNWLLDSDFMETQISGSPYGKDVSDWTIHNVTTRLWNCPSIHNKDVNLRASFRQDYVAPRATIYGKEPWDFKQPLPESLSWSSTWRMALIAWSVGALHDFDDYHDPEIYHRAWTIVNPFVHTQQVQLDGETDLSIFSGNDQESRENLRRQIKRLLEIDPPHASERVPEFLPKWKRAMRKSIREMRILSDQEAAQEPPCTVCGGKCLMNTLV